MVVAAYIFIVGLKDGDYRRLTYVYDQYDTESPCGLGDKADYPYLYFPNMSGDDAAFKASRVCLKECPTETDTTGGNSVDCWNGTDDTCTTTAPASDLTWVQYATVECNFTLQF